MKADGDLSFLFEYNHTLDYPDLKSMPVLVYLNMAYVF